MKLGQEPTTFNPIGDSSTKLNCQIPVTLTQVNKDASDALGNGAGGYVTIEQVINIFNTYISNTTLSSLLDVNDLLGNAPDGSILKKVGIEWTYDTISQYSLVPATASVLGGVKIGSGITVQVDGTISVADNYDYWVIQTGDENYSNISRHGTLTISCTGIVTAIVADGVLTLGGSFTESDPIFTAWDKSTGISITESQISDLKAYLTAETDPVFSASAAAGITLSDIANWNSNTTYTHPTQSAINPVLTGASVLASLNVNTLGHVVSATTRTLSLTDLGFSDGSFVHISGTETITGEKHFTSSYTWFSSISCYNPSQAAIEASSVDSAAITAMSNNSTAAYFDIATTDGNATHPVVTFRKKNVSQSDIGNGGYLSFYIQKADSYEEEFARQSWSLSNATVGSEASAFHWWTKNSGEAIASVMSLDSTGKLTVKSINISDGTVNKYLYLDSNNDVTFVDIPPSSTGYSLTLPYGATVADRVSAAVEGVDYPTGWTIAADNVNPADLVVTHSLGKRIANVSVYIVTGSGPGMTERQLFGNAAYSGIIATGQSSLKIESLSTVASPIVVNLIFV